VSWEMAVNGEDLPKAEKLAQESVDTVAGTMNLDTLAVLQFLNGDKSAADSTILRAIDLAKENDKHQFEDRLEEFRIGKLNLR